MIEMRPYQMNFINGIRASMAVNRSVLAVLPTGGGKTRIAAYMAKSAREKKKRIMFTCHRDFLIDQTAEAFDDINLPYTLLAAGEQYNPYAQVVIASIDLLKRRLDKIQAPDVLIPDEAAHSAAAGWAKVIEHYQAQGCYTIGLTACPERLGGQGLRTWYKDMVLGPSTADLIELGYLSKYKPFAPTKPDLGGVHTRGGDYVREEVNNRMDKPSITGDAVKEYRKIAEGKQALMFCCSIEHSHHVAEAFREAGFASAHIGADTDKRTRAAMLADYRAGKLKVLTSVDIFNEGFNVPAATYAGLLRPTKSLSIFLQQIGRVMRREDGKDFAFISDHANNIAFHGFPDDEREWTLDDRVKKKRGDQDEKTFATRQCPAPCFYTHKPAPKCPECGYEYPVQYRTVDEVDGELEEIKRDEARKQARQEVGRAKTREDLRKIAAERNYKPGWVTKMARLKRITT